jgi:dipeptidyl aminopeptidase/acylaminoacyl peptidase
MSTSQPSFEQFLNIRAARQPSFSPDGKFLSFVTNITGVMEVWNVPINLHSSYAPWPEQLTFRGETGATAVYSPTDNVLLFSGDVGGNERAQLYTLQGSGSALEPLTDKPEVMYQFGDWSPDGKSIVYASNERDARYYDIYERDLADGTIRTLLTQDGTNGARGYSPDGAEVLIARSHSNVRNALFLLNRKTGEIRAITPEEGGEGPALHTSVAWSADRSGLYLLSNRGRQFKSLAWLELATTELTYLRDDAWDVENLAVTHDGSRLALSLNEDGYSRLEIFDVSQGWDAQRSLTIPALPQGVIYELVWSSDGKRLAMTVQATADTSDIWIWDVEEELLWRATNSSSAGIPRENFIAPTLVRYPTFDGREVPAFLYVPEGKDPGKIPFVVNVHGGPESQARPILNPITQYLLSSGYGVFVPNVRGSTGYGYEYQSLDDVRLRMDSVKDVQHGVFWLRESGFADPESITVMGASYGGFMVLSALTTYPDLWAAGVDIVGIANFVTFMENTGPWRRKLREAEYGSLENDRDFLEQISPIRHIDQIAVPLFVVHGANDPRVPVGEAEQVVSALQSRQIPVEYMRFEDEGHGLVKRANILVAYPAIVRFLDHYVRHV